MGALRVLELTRGAGSSGGAAIAALDLHNTISAVTEASLVVAQPSAPNATVLGPSFRGWNIPLVLTTAVDRLDNSVRQSVAPVLRERSGLGSRRQLDKLVETADVVQVYWTDRMLGSTGLLRLARSGKPIVIVPMDFSMISGGCHYPADGCLGFTGDCRACPLTRSRSLQERIVRTRTVKRELLGLANVHVIAGNGWYAERVVAAGCDRNRVHVIHTPVSDAFHTPPGTQAFRSALGVASDVPIVCVGAMRLDEPRKRVGVATNVACALLQRRPDSQLVVVGGGALPVPPQFAGRTHRTGILDAGGLANVLHSADLFISASVDDGGPMMVAAALSAGAAVASPRIGYAADLLDDGVAGRIINADPTPSDVDALDSLIGARAVDPLASRAETQALAGSFRRSTAAAAYLAVYNQILCS